MSSKKYYVILTGSKNNAGDFLIRKKAVLLFAALRTDRDIVDYDGWKPLTAEQLQVINGAEALILMGGPALQYQMYPGIYPLVKDLSQIKVPVILMGTGYKDQHGSWTNTPNYKLSEQTVSLLKKVADSGFTSSVRDYHTLNVLFHHGFKNVLMTGCPALYSLDHIGQKAFYPASLRSIAFSLGVSYISSPKMFAIMCDNIRKLKEHYSDAMLTVYFHHSINKNVKQQADMISWLEQNKIRYQDISNSADGLIEVYSKCDLHVGYRVHSHIFASSISKPSVLFSEDGRGKALYTVIGGLILDAYQPLYYTFAKRVQNRLGLLKEKMVAYDSLSADMINHIDYEFQNDFPRQRISRLNIDSHFEQMKKFILSLP